MLDVGCGVGLTDQILKSQLPKLVGVDISRKSLDAARRQKSPARLLPFRPTANCLSSTVRSMPYLQCVSGTMFRRSMEGSSSLSFRAFLLKTGFFSFTSIIRGILLPVWWSPAVPLMTMRYSSRLSKPQGGFVNLVLEILARITSCYSHSKAMPSGDGRRHCFGRFLLAHNMRFAPHGYDESSGNWRVRCCADVWQRGRT